MRGDVFRPRPPPVVPTSTRARATVFRPEIEVPGHGRTLALCDGLTAVDPQARLSTQVGWLSDPEMVDVDIALQGLLDLDHGR
jgi:mRNA interferase MazF